MLRPRTNTCFAKHFLADANNADDRVRELLMDMDNHPADMADLQDFPYEIGHDLMDDHPDHMADPQDFPGEIGHDPDDCIDSCDPSVGWDAKQHAQDIPHLDDKYVDNQPEAPMDSILTNAIGSPSWTASVLDLLDNELEHPIDMEPIGAKHLADGSTEANHNTKYLNNLAGDPSEHLVGVARGATRLLTNLKRFPLEVLKLHPTTKKVLSNTMEVSLEAATELLGQAFAMYIYTDGSSSRTGCGTHTKSSAGWALAILLMTHHGSLFLGIDGSTVNPQANQEASNNLAEISAVDAALAWCYAFLDFLNPEAR